MHKNKITTHNIEISVRTHDESHFSDYQSNKFIHTYQIKIRNNRMNPVQLLRRHWIIMTDMGVFKEVSGKGVIGKQPIIPPKGQHNYESWCEIHTEFGKMQGSFEMLDLETKEIIKVKIPTFNLLNSH